MIDIGTDDENFKSKKKSKVFRPISRSVPKACQLRDTGNRSNCSTVAREFVWAAEDNFVHKEHEEVKFKLPEESRSTFLMVFSPDGKVVASTHGNHSIYITDVRTNRTIRTLTGHPRTPWCIAFHPSSNQILASGCLGGQVRVWDLHGGSEVWTSFDHSVIASLAFHPIERVLVIATQHELHFWDWNEVCPFASCHTGWKMEKIRYVAFDHLGEKLITGVANSSVIQSQWDQTPSSSETNQFNASNSESSMNLQNSHMNRVALLLWSRNPRNSPSRQSLEGSASSFDAQTFRTTYTSNLIRESHLHRAREYQRRRLRRVSKRVKRYFSSNSENLRCLSRPQPRPPTSSLVSVEALSSTLEQISTHCPRFPIFLDMPNRNCNNSETNRNSTDCEESGEDLRINPQTIENSGLRRNENPHLERDSRDYTNQNPRMIRNSWGYSPINFRRSRDSGENINENPCTSKDSRETLNKSSRLTNRDGPSRLETSFEKDCTQPETARNDTPNTDSRENIIENLDFQEQSSRSWRSRWGQVDGPSNEMNLSTNSMDYEQNMNPNESLRDTSWTRAPLPPLRMPSPIDETRSRFARGTTCTMDSMNRINSFRNTERATNFDSLESRATTSEENNLNFIAERFSRRNSESNRNDSDSTNDLTVQASLSLSENQETQDSNERRKVLERKTNFSGTNPGYLERSFHLGCRKKKESNKDSCSRTSGIIASGSTYINSIAAKRTRITDKSSTDSSDSSELNQNFTEDESDSSEESDDPLNSPLNAPLASNSLQDRFRRKNRGSLSQERRCNKNLLENQREAIISAIKSLRQSSSLNSTNPSSQSSDSSLEHRAFRSYVNSPRPSSSRADDYRSKIVDLYFRCFRRLSQMKEMRSAGTGGFPPHISSNEFNLNSINSPSSAAFSVPISNSDRVGAGNSGTSGMFSRSVTSEEMSSSRKDANDSAKATKSTESDNSNDFSPLSPVNHSSFANCSNTVNSVDRIPVLKSSNAESKSLSTNDSNEGSTNSDQVSLNTQENASEMRHTVNMNPHPQSVKSLDEMAVSKDRKEGKCSQDEKSPAKSNSSNESQCSAVKNLNPTESSDLNEGNRSSNSNEISFSETIENIGNNSDNVNSSVFKVCRVKETLLTALFKRMFEMLKKWMSQIETCRADLEFLCSSEFLSKVLAEDKPSVKPTKDTTETGGSSTAKKLPEENITVIKDTFPSSHSNDESPGDILIRLVDYCLRKILESINSSDSSASRNNKIFESKFEKSDAPSSIQSGEKSKTPPSTSASDASSISSSSGILKSSVRSEVPSHANQDEDEDEDEKNSKVKQGASSSRRDEIEGKCMGKRVSECGGSSSPTCARLDANEIMEKLYELEIEIGRWDMSTRVLGRTESEEDFMNYIIILKKLFNEARECLQIKLRNIPDGAAKSEGEKEETPRKRQRTEFNDGASTSTASSNQNQPTSPSLSDPMLRQFNNSRQSLLSSPPQRRSNSSLEHVSGSHTTPETVRDLMIKMQNARRRMMTDSFKKERERNRLLSRYSPKEGDAVSSASSSSPRQTPARQHCYDEPRQKSKDSEVSQAVLDNCKGLLLRMLGNIKDKKSSGKRLREEDNSGAGSSSANGSQSQSPVFVRLSDPILRQFNNSRQSSLSPHQRDVNNHSSDSLSTSNSLHRSALDVPLVRVNDQPVISSSDSDESPQRNRSCSSPPYFPPGSGSRTSDSLFSHSILHSRVFTPARPDSLRQFFRPLRFNFQHRPVISPRFVDFPQRSLSGRNLGVYTELPLSLHHRIQAWDFSKLTMPDLTSGTVNLVVVDCKIYNDASVDISSDSSFIVTLLPSSRFGVTCMLGIYSLQWETLGQCLYMVSFEQNAVSVSLSPTCRYLVVGLAARRNFMDTDKCTVAQILRLDGAVPSSGTRKSQKGKLTEVRNIELSRDFSNMSLNCIRWAPTPGQGLVCGTNTGQLTFIR